MFTALCKAASSTVYDTSVDQRTATRASAEKGGSTRNPGTTRVQGYLSAWRWKDAGALAKDISLIPPKRQSVNAFDDITEVSVK